MRETIMRVVMLFGTGAALALGLAACDGKPSAVASRDQSPFTAAPGPSSAAGAVDPRDAPVPQIGGKPMWAANRKHTAEENAQYQFAKNGGDFAAKSETDYVTKAHAFIERPPHDVQTLDRSNGDRLIYDPSANIFAVVSRDGAPRTMFKPRGGATYWAQQKDREDKRSRTSSNSGSDQS
jgi:hypothetical protein